MSRPKDAILLLVLHSLDRFFKMAAAAAFLENYLDCEFTTNLFFSFEVDAWLHQS